MPLFDDKESDIVMIMSLVRSHVKVTNHKDYHYTIQLSFRSEYHSIFFSENSVGKRMLEVLIVTMKFFSQC